MMIINFNFSVFIENSSSTSNTTRFTKKELIIYIVCFVVALIFWNISSEGKKGITPTSMHLFAVFLL